MDDGAIGDTNQPLDKLIGSPIKTSSPSKTKTRSIHTRARSLKILNVNCQSIRAKKQSFLLLVEMHDPDIILGTESWLSPQITNNEVFPTGRYNIERRDRPDDPHGGVFIATKKDLIAVREVELETECEIAWCKFDVAGSKTIHIGVYYRPHESDETSLIELARSVEKLNHNHTIIIGGDFNFPGWDWGNGRIKQFFFRVHHLRI